MEKEYKKEALYVMLAKSLLVYALPARRGRGQTNRTGDSELRSSPFFISYRVVPSEERIHS